MGKRTNKKITEQDLQFLVDHWEDMSKVELAKSLSVELHYIGLMAHTLRKLGVKLTHKKYASQNRMTYESFVAKYLAKKGQDNHETRKKTTKN